MELFPRSWRLFFSLLLLTTSLLQGCATTSSDSSAVGNTATPLLHTVQTGETLYGIARLYGRTWQEIAQWNSISPPYNLTTGQQLIVSEPTGSVAITQPVPEDSANLPPPRVIITDNQQVQPPKYSTPITTPSRTTKTTTPRVENSGGSTHIVSAGETLYSIARVYGYDVNQVAAWNGLQPPYTLSVGQSLRVSSSGASSSSTRVVTPVVEETYRAPVSSSSGTSTYTVQRGDTLYSIARQFNEDVAELASRNGVTTNYKVVVGDNFKVKGGSSSSSAKSSRSTSSAAKYHTVQRGETLYSISRKYGQDVTEVARWNGIRSPYNVHLGQKLIVTPASVRSSSVEDSEPVPIKTSVASTSNTLRNETRVTPANTSAIPVVTTATASAGNSPAMVVKPSSTFHTVKNGETMASIAKQYGLTTQELSLWNGIGLPYSVYPGQKLLIVGR